MKLLEQMVRLPIGTLQYGMDAMANTLRDLQRPAAAVDLSRRAWPYRDAIDNVRDVVDRRPLPKESEDMDDQDLSSDELKLVRFRIIFRKRDFATTLRAGERVIDYPTDGGSFGAIEISDYWRDVAAKRVRLPALWRELGYPEKDTPQRGWRLPREDRRYVGFVYKVVHREDLQEKEYDKLQVRALRTIADNSKKR
jgi:hypothetical protein